jgi:hypothetical protein
MFGAGEDRSADCPGPLLLPVHGGEERGDVAGEEFGFLGGGGVAAAGHHGPAADVVQAFGPFLGRLATPPALSKVAYWDGREGGGLA